MKTRIYLAFLFALLLPTLASALPPGNYLNSCSMCTMMFGNQLNCVCNDKQGFPNNTSLSVPPRCTYIQNINGNLKCTAYRHRHHRHHHHDYRAKVNITAGPIWNDSDANQKCPRVCAQVRGKWTGHWKTVQQMQQSVCTCKIWRRG